MALKAVRNPGKLPEHTKNLYKVSIMENKNTITYFLTPGDVNTIRTFELARERAQGLGIKTIIVASSSGATGAMAADSSRILM